MTFTPRRDMERVLASTPEMKRYLQRVADDAADELNRRWPYPDMLGGIEATGDTAMTGDGLEGRVKIRGPFWLWEWGTINHGAKPAARPGMQSVLSRYGGRWKSAR